MIVTGFIYFTNNVKPRRADRCNLWRIIDELKQHENTNNQRDPADDTFISI